MSTKACRSSQCKWRNAHKNKCIIQVFQGASVGILAKQEAIKALGDLSLHNLLDRMKKYLEIILLPQILVHNIVTVTTSSVTEEGGCVWESETHTSSNGIICVFISSSKFLEFYQGCTQTA